MNILKNLEKEQMEKLTQGKNLPDFKAGDTLRVHTKVKEGDRERIQIYEGVCIARKNDGLNSSFTVRKISFAKKRTHAPRRVTASFPGARGLPPCERRHAGFGLEQRGEMLSRRESEMRSDGRYARVTCGEIPLCP